MFLFVLQNYYYQTMFAFPDFELSPPSFPQIIEIFFKEDGNPADAVQLVLPGQNALEISLRFLQRTIHNIIQVICSIECSFIVYIILFVQKEITWVLFL